MAVHASLFCINFSGFRKDNWPDRQVRYRRHIKYADLYRMYQPDGSKKKLLQRTFITVAEKRYEATELTTAENYPTIYKPSDYRVIGGNGRYSTGSRVPRTNDNDAKLVIIGKRSGLTKF